MSNRYRKLSIVLLAVGMIVSLAACGKAEQRNPSDRESTSNTAVEPAQTDNAQNDTGSDAAVDQTVIRLAFGDTVMTAALDDSETSCDFLWQRGYILSGRADPHGADHLGFEPV